MASIMENDNDANLRQVLTMIQGMIDISADRLQGLRTQCNSSAELTQQEIRTLEAKLVKMFSELLITKAKLPDHISKVPANATEIKQWLRVVGKFIIVIVFFSLTYSILLRVLMLVFYSHFACTNGTNFHVKKSYGAAINLATFSCPFIVVVIAVIIYIV